MEDESFTDLMPTINPNLDEVVSENVFKPVEDNPPKNNEIFICKTLSAKQDPEKKKYPHLEKARATALANRQRKAKAKAELKELENTKKLELREEKKKLRVEKNRTNARNNYHKKQEAKALLEAEETDVWKESITNEVFKKPSKMGLSYDEFEKYMDTYNEKKVVASKPKPIIKPKQVIKPKLVNKPQIVQSNHPVNYFNPHQRNKIDMDDLFSL